jgi:tRNA pseudouridine13 synthase
VTDPAADPRVRAPALALPSPLPARRLVDAPPVAGARIKERPGDFLVEELQLYDPCGEGEHLYLRIVKEGMSHHEMVDMLCAHFEVGPEAIGTAGMKDRVAVTSQTVSVHLPRKPQLRAIEDPRVQVLWVTWHANKLRRGHLAGNRFSIRIRGIEPVRAPAIWRAIGAMERLGVPNHFGPQRFGMRANGHVLGALQLAGRHEELLGELLSTRGSPFPESERPAREAVDAGNYAEALRLWPRGLDAEYAATRALHRGADARSAVRGIRREILELWGDAWQSAVFNALLDARLAAGTLGAIEPGDVVSKQANGAKFLADDAAFAAEGEESLAARAARFEISATGPLPGHDAMRPSGAVLERERAAIAAMGVDPARFDAPGRRPSGDRRPFRIRLSNPEIEAGFDDHGTYVRVSFDLPAGAYATVALREALGDGLVDASAALPA